MRTLNVFFACALGALIGSLVALQLSPLFWWVGSMVGFTTGYLSYEYKKIPVAVRTTWERRKEAFNIVIESLNQLLKFLAESFVVFIAALVMILGLAWMFGLVGTLLASYLALIGLDLKGALISNGLSLALSLMGLLFRWWITDDDDFDLKLLCTLSPIIVIVYWIPKGLFHLAKNMPKITKGIANLATEAVGFVIDIIRLIHSDFRLLCGVDAAIGAGIGYLLHYALIGALAGGILGVLNYHLVSIKLLKLVPQKQS